MNDPGLDHNIQEASNDIERLGNDSTGDDEEEEEENFLDPSRWWFASTACPLIAGTFGPIANAFSICALPQSWREYTPPGVGEDAGTDIPDPAWLIAIETVSLVLALIANSALLLNMARRLPFAIAQPITIIGWFTAAVLLVILVSIANSSLFLIPPSTDHALTQAYYYGIIAAALYLIISILMTVTVIGAYRGHYKKEFRLTTSQRTLMVQTIAFMAYLLLGALVYSKVEGWRYLDAVYWADFTLLTVGIGDFTPTTVVGQGLLFPFAIGGIVSLGLVIGSIRSLVLERGKQKLAARFTEKKREATLKSVDMEKRTISVGLFTKYTFSQEGLSESQRREQEFAIMRMIQEAAASRRRWLSLLLSLSVTIALWFGAAGIFTATESNQEGWDYFTSLYFSYTSLLTIGYGDYFPGSNSGKPVFVFWSLLAVPALTVLISNMGDTIIKGFSDLADWAARLTVLPGEQGFKAQWKATISALGPKLHSIRTRDFAFLEPPGILPYHAEGSKHENLRQHHMTRLGELMEEQAMEDEEELEQHGGQEHRDLHLYHYILTRELRELMTNMTDASKQYSYAEWAYYLRLMGQDEGDSSRHRKPPIVASKDIHHGRNLNEDEAQGLGQAGMFDNHTAWSWLGTRSPLMATKSETDWLVDGLSRMLEKEMARVRKRGVKGWERGQALIPDSVRDLLKVVREDRKKQIESGGRSSSDKGKERLKKRQ